MRRRGAIIKTIILTLSAKREAISRAIHYRTRQLGLALGIGLLTFQAGMAAPKDITPVDTAATQVTQQGGVPVVDIATPSAAGVSHNRFTDFNVDKSGVVINNSLVNGDSALAGSLSANPNLNPNAATLILNEVVGTQRSELLGSTEIFGEKAGYILANPYGITCDGCDFFRTPTQAGDFGSTLSELVLTTGSPVLDITGVQPLRINVDPAVPADIIIGPNGLNASQIDATTLLTREVTIHSLINAGNNPLRIIAGSGSLSFADGVAPADRPWTAVQPATNSVTVAIDAAIAGAMHAGQIYIQATEHGVGVSLAGDLIATDGDIELTAAGDIRYRQASAARDITVSTTQAAAQITAERDNSAGRNIVWNLAGSGELNEKGRLLMQAGETIQFNCSGSAACDVFGRDDIVLNAKRVETNAVISTGVGRQLTINAALAAQADIYSGNVLTINAASGDIQAQQLTAANALVLSTGSAGAGVTATGINANNGDLIWRLNDSATLQLQPGGELFAADAARFECLPPLQCAVNSDALTITASSVSSEADLHSLSTLAITATRGSINTAHLSADQNIDITTRAADTNLTIDGIAAGTDFNWQLSGNSQLIVGAGGQIVAGQNVNLDCPAGESCTAVSLGKLHLVAQQLNTIADITTTAGNDLLIDANVASAGVLQSGGLLSIQAANGDIHTQGVLQAADDIRLNSAAGGRILLDGAVRTGGDLYLLGDGYYLHGERTADDITGDRVIDIFELTNNGRLADLQNGQLQATRLNNNGLIQSDGALQLNVDERLVNTGTIASLEGIVSIDHRQTGEYVGEIVNSGDILALTLSTNQSPASDLIVDPTTLLARHHQAILNGEQRSATDLVNEIDSANRRLLSELTVDSGRIGAVLLNTSLLNNSGRIAGTQVLIDGGSFNNTGGLISAASHLNIQGSVLNNRNSATQLGVITARYNIDIDLTGSLTNVGQIEGGDISINAPLQNNLNSGLTQSASGSQSLGTNTYIATVAAQPEFAASNSGGPYYTYQLAGDGASGLVSDLNALTDAFLLDADATLAANTVILGDDVYLASLIGEVLRARGGIPFVTDDRHDVLQLGTLYGNTLNFMNRTGLRFGEAPTAQMRVGLSAPIVSFKQSLVNGQQVYVPTLHLPPQDGIGNQNLNNLISQILARNDLLLRGDQINNNSSIEAGNNLIIEAVDLTQDSSKRSWYVDAQGKVQYHDAQIVAGGSVGIRLSGNYVQRGGQVLAQGAVAIEAQNLQVSNAGAGRAMARISAGDDLFLLASARADYDRNTKLNSGGDAVLSAGTSLGFDGQLSGDGDMQLVANDLRIGSGDGFTRGTALRAGGDLLLQSEQDIQLTAADIRAGGQLSMLATEGDIINTAGRIHGEESVFMQAGGDIVNRSLLRVRDAGTKRYSRYGLNRGLFRSARFYRGGYGRYGRYGRGTVKVRRQRVETATAEISAGEGGLTQIAGGDIQNIGGKIASKGDVYQKADGSIINRSLTRNYVKEQRISRSGNTGRYRRYGREEYWDSRRNYRVSTQTRTALTQQSASISAGGNLIQDAGGSIKNIGGSLKAQKNIWLSADKGIENRSVQVRTTNSTRVRGMGRRYGRAERGYYNRYSRYNRSRGWDSTQTRNHLLTANIDAGESLIAQVGGDDKAAIGDIFNDGNLRAGGDLVLRARDIENRRLQQRQRLSATHYRDVALDTGRVTAGGDLLLNAERDILDVAGRYRAGGDLMLSAGGDINQQALTLREYEGTERGFWFWRSLNTRSVTRSVSGNFEAGGAVSLQAGGDLSLVGSDISAKDAIALSGQDISLGAVQTGSRTETRWGAHEIRQTTRHDVAKLNTDGSIFIQAERDLTTYGSQLKAGSDADDHIIINAGGDMHLLGVNNEDYYYYYRKKKKSFGRSKTTIIENRKVTLAETTIDTGGSLLVNIDSDENNQLAGRASGTMVLEGTGINVGQDAMLYAGEGVNMLSGIEYEFRRRETHKKGFGGFSRSGRVSQQEAKRLGHAEINSGGDTVLLSGGDINVVAGHIKATNIIAEAGFGVDEDSGREASINILGDKEALATYEHKYKRSFKLKLEDDFLSFAEEKHNKRWKVDDNYVGSMLQAMGDIQLKALTDINIVGSELTAGHDLQLAARDISIMAGRDYALDKEEETIKRIGIEVKADGNGVSAFAGVESKSVIDEYTLDDVHSSLLQAGNQIRLQAEGDIHQSASDLMAGSDVTFLAGGLIRLDGDDSIETRSHTETLRRDGVSVSVQHNLKNTREAIKGANDGDNAVSDASGTLQAIDAIDSFMSGPTASGFAGTTITTTSSMESTAQARGASIQAGGDINLEAGTDISLIGSQLAASNNIRLRGQDISIKAAKNRYRQDFDYHTERYGIVASAQKNSASIGFGGSFADQESKYKANGGQASVLYAGGNTDISAGRDLAIHGSDLESGEDTSLIAGRDLYLGALGFDSDYDEKARSGGGEVGVAATVGEGGASLGIYGSANFGMNDLERDGRNYRNSHVTAGNRLTMRSGRDTQMVGATAEADDVDLDVGRNLTVSSVQDTGKADGRQIDASLRVVVGMGVSASGSFGYGETKGKKEWVEEQTRLIGRKSLDARIEGHTQLDGAVIAADSGELTLDTGTLGFRDIRDRDKEKSYYANVSLSISGETGSNPQQQQNNVQTGQPTRSGQDASGGGSVGGTFSGYYNNTDRRQINRATIGAGTVLVRSDQSNGRDSTAGLNRNLAMARQITRDESDEINVYVSDSSIKAVASPMKTLDQWKQDFVNYPANTAEAITGLIRSGEYGVDVANAVGSVFGGASFSEAFKQAHGAIAGRVAAWQITKYEQKAALTLKNAQTKTTKEIQAAAQVLASTMAELSGVDQDVLVKAILEDVDAVSFKGATDGRNIYVDFNTDGGTSVSNSGAIANVLGHEVGHIPGNNEQVAEYLGNISEQAWQNELGRSGLGRDQYDADADKAWVSNNRSNETLVNNTREFFNTDLGKLDFRQLHLVEGELIRKTAMAFAVQQGISPEVAINRLRTQAKRQTDTEYDDGRVDAAASQWLQDMSVAYLKGREGNYDVELYNATAEQKADHDLFAQYNTPIDNLLNRRLGDEVRWSTDFINSPLASGYDQQESNHVRLNALARVELRDEAFAGGNYGSNDLIYGFRDYNDNLRALPDLRAHESTGSFILNPNEIRQYSSGNLNKGLDLEPVAAVQAFGLNTNLMRLDTNSWGTGWLSAEGHRDIFAEAIRYATEGSPTPMLVFNYGGRMDPSQLSAMVDRELGGHRSAQEINAIRQSVLSMSVGDSLNLSPELEITTARTMLNNENFVSGFHRYMDEVTDNTNFFKEPGAHITYILASIAEQTGRNWELTFTDDKAPLYMRNNASFGVAVDIASMLPILKAMSGTRTATKAGTAGRVGAQVDDLARTGLPTGYRELPAAGTAANATAGLPTGFRRVVDASGDTVVLGPRGGVYRATDMVDSVGNALYTNNGKAYALEGGTRTYVPASQRVAAETAQNTSSAQAVSSLEPGNARSTSLPRNGTRTVIDQGNLPTCGPNSCAMALDTSGRSYNLTLLITDSRVTSQGAYMGDMVTALRNQGLSTARVRNRVSINELAQATANGNPAIVATRLDRGGHAVVVDGITTRQGQRVVAIRDPAGGRQYFTPLTEFEQRFTGQAILTNP